MDAGQMQSLRPALGEFLQEFRDCFKREKTFQYLQAYVGGLLTDLPRKSIEPIALAAGLPVRTLQEFLADFDWDPVRAETQLHHRLADRRAAGPVIGVLDATGHPKQGDHTPGVHHQYCGQSGKQDNCVVAQHLMYCDDEPANPFACMLCSDLYLPQAWAEDQARCRRAGLPDAVSFRTKWQIGIDQIERSIGHGVRFDYLVFDAHYGKAPAFWFELDRLGQIGVGEVALDFHCWASPPAYESPAPNTAPRPAHRAGPVQPGVPPATLATGEDQGYDAWSASLAIQGRTRATGGASRSASSPAQYADGASLLVDYRPGAWQFRSAVLCQQCGRRRGCGHAAASVWRGTAWNSGLSGPNRKLD